MSGPRSGTESGLLLANTVTIANDNVTEQEVMGNILRINGTHGQLGQHGHYAPTPHEKIASSIEAAASAEGASPPPPPHQGMTFLGTVRILQMINRRQKRQKLQSKARLQEERRRLLNEEGLPNLYTDNDSSRENFSGTISSIVHPGGEIGNQIKSDEMLSPPVPAETIYSIVFGKRIISMLLVAAPVALIAHYLHWGDIAVFCSNFLVIIPLASILSDFTEEAALHTNDITAGLLNASFGNAVEVVIMIQALLADEIRVVQASLLGSILSNLLLVLGCCFFFGGLVYKEQSFNATYATANMGLLALSSIALVLPTPYAKYYQIHDEQVLKVSRGSAIFLLFMYLQMLVFQLHTHAYLCSAHHADTAAAAVASSSMKEAPALSLKASLVGLAGTTLLVALFSNFLVGSIDGFVQASGISRTFVGIVLLPIVGNAVEHVSAVAVAMKDKMDLAMGVAIGSCTQISLMIVPISVLVGWVFDKPMTLNFPYFEVISYILSVMTVSIVLSNSRCNWLVGSLLITTYVLLAIGFWFEEVRDF